MKTSNLYRALCAGLIIFGLIQISDAATRGPYLQNATKTSITIHWRTSSSYVGMVRYGTSLSTINTDVIESGSGTDHIVTISGLAAGTKYYYQIGDSVGAVLETPPDQSNQFFRTNPNGAEPTRIWVLGDPGTGTQNQRNVRDAYTSLTASEGDETDVVLALGDNAYNDGTDSEYGSNFFDVYQETFRKTPVWSTQGNHERNFGVYARRFLSPNQRRGRRYAFRV